MAADKRSRVAGGGGALLPGLPDEQAIICLARVERVSSFWGVCTAWRRLLSDNYFRSTRSALGLPLPAWLYVLVSPPRPSLPAWYAFDPLSRRWGPLPPMPTAGVQFETSIAGCIGYSHPIQSTATPTKLLVVAATRAAAAAGGGAAGRYDAGLPAPLVFDTATGEWSTAPPLAVPRRWCAAGALGETVVIASGAGRDWDANVARTAQACDLSVGADRRRWRPLPKLLSCKLSAEATAAVSLGGRLYIASGRGVFARTGVVLDGHRWAEMPPGMLSGWTGPAVAVDGKLFVLDEAAGRLRSYDPDADSWTPFLVDARLRGIRNLVASPHGSKICGSVGSVLWVLDLATDPVEFFELRPPVSGEIVGLQVLAGPMSLNF